MTSSAITTRKVAVKRNKLVLLFIAPIIAACSYGDNTPGATATGAAIGGLTSAAVFHGATAPLGIVAGALVGGAIGNNVGQRIDAEQQQAVSYPIYDEPSYPDAHHVIGFIRGPMQEELLQCRHITTTVYHRHVPPTYRIDVICLMRDGRWHFIGAE